MESCHSPPPNFFPKTSTWSLSYMASTPAPATPLSTLAPAPLKNDLIPSLARIFLPQSIEPEYFQPSPEVIIILLLIVSMGQEAMPAPMVTLHPSKKLMMKVSLRFSGRRGLIESNMPKYRPLQMKIPMQEMTNPLQSPANPSLARVFLQTSINPLNCFQPPFFAFLRSFDSLVLAQSSEYTKVRDTEPANPPEAMLAKNQIRYPSLFLSRLNSLLKKSLKAKLRAWVGKYLRTLVPFPFQRALIPYSVTTLWPQFKIPVQGVFRAPVLIMASMFWSRSLMSSMGAAQVLEIAAETPPIRNSIMKVLRSFFF